MSVSIVTRKSADESRQFLVALVVACVTMIVVALVAVYLLGALAGPGPSASSLRSHTAEDLTVGPKPTAVWKFRPEWQKPEQP